jgi:hypothetical protein
VSIRAFSLFLALCKIFVGETTILCVLKNGVSLECILSEIELSQFLNSKALDER